MLYTVGKLTQKGSCRVTHFLHYKYRVIKVYYKFGIYYGICCTLLTFRKDMLSESIREYALPFCVITAKAPSQYVIIKQKLYVRKLEWNKLSEWILSFYVHSFWSSFTLVFRGILKRTVYFPLQASYMCVDIPRNKCATVDISHPFLWAPCNLYQESIPETGSNTKY